MTRRATDAAVILLLTVHVARAADHHPSLTILPKRAPCDRPAIGSRQILAAGCQTGSCVCSLLALDPVFCCWKGAGGQGAPVALDILPPGLTTCRPDLGAAAHRMPLSVSWLLQEDSWYARLDIADRDRMYYQEPEGRISATDLCWPSWRLCLWSSLPALR